jgi:hypothetical protein
VSLYLSCAGVAILLVGLLLPGWDTASLPKRAVKRRIYWEPDPAPRANGS